MSASNTWLGFEKAVSKQHLAMSAENKATLGNVSIVSSCVKKPYGFELLTLPSVALFYDWRWIKNNPKRLEIKHV